MATVVWTHHSRQNIHKSRQRSTGGRPGDSRRAVNQATRTPSSGRRDPSAAFPLGMTPTGTGSLVTLTYVSRASILQNLDLSYHLSRWVSRERMGRFREMGFTMKRVFMQFAAILLAAVLAVPMAAPARAAVSDELTLRVGLAYGSNALVSANLENNTGYGSGYRFGYFDSDLDFVELGRTSASLTQLTMVKAQNVWVSGSSYSTTDNGGSLIGCYHVLVEEDLKSFDAAQTAAEKYDGGFVAWIDGEYQVRAGAYETQEEAQAAADDWNGEVVFTSSYAVNVTQTGKAQILFQFDGGSAKALGIMPDANGAEDTRTWFKNLRYPGGFRYERINGGNLTVVNIVDMEDYLKGVVPYEMSDSWPLEALKAQAVCARSYSYNSINKHSSYHFDICNGTDCQVYYGYGGKDVNNANAARAVEETAGVYALYNGKPIEAFYSASHGGASESVYNVWGSSLTTYPYLCGVEDPYEADTDSINPYSSWTVSYTTASLTQRLQSKGYGTGTTVASLDLTYSDLGNVIAVKVNYANGQSNTFKPTSIRSTFNVSSIRFQVNTSGTGEGETPDNSLPVNGTGTLPEQDSYYVISGSGTVSQAGREDLYAISGSGTTQAVAPSSGSSSGGSSVTEGNVVHVTGSSYVFEGSGNGHQIGMSQWGAYAMAKRGLTYKDIVTFYFPGVTVG